MRDKKFQIFVSSTYLDLIEERQAAVEAILASGNIPAGMELFAAGDQSQMKVIKRWIDESDIYLLILGGRYGSIDPSTGKSYTHLEFEYALEINKPFFSVVISKEGLENKVKISGVQATEQGDSKKYNEFKQTVENNLVSFWTDKKDIEIAIYKSINDLIDSRKDMIGWIKGDNSVNTGAIAEEIARLAKENSELRERLNSLNSNNALYGSLSFDQLKELLSNQQVTLNKRNYSLFDFLLEYGDSIAVEGIYPSGSEISEIVSFLLAAKIIQKPKSGYDHIFTEIGHDFYLKAKLYKMQNNT